MLNSKWVGSVGRDAVIEPLGAPWHLCWGSWTWGGCKTNWTGDSLERATKCELHCQMPPLSCKIKKLQYLCTKGQAFHCTALGWGSRALRRMSHLLTMQDPHWRFNSCSLTVCSIWSDMQDQNLKLYLLQMASASIFAPPIHIKPAQEP